MDHEDWQIVWQTGKDVALAFFALVTTAIGARYGYLRFIKPYDTEATKEGLKFDRIDRNTTIKILSRLLQEERDARDADGKSCEAKIEKLETRILQLENDRQSQRVEIQEAVAASERATGMMLEVERDRTALREENNQLKIRTAILHTELVKIKRRIGLPESSDPHIDLSQDSQT